MVYLFYEGRYFFLSNSQLKAPGLTTMINGKNKTLYMQVGCLFFTNKEMKAYELSLGECWSAELEVTVSNPGWTNTQGLLK